MRRVRVGCLTCALGASACWFDYSACGCADIYCNLPSDVCRCLLGLLAGFQFKSGGVVDCLSIDNLEIEHWHLFTSCACVAPPNKRSQCPTLSPEYQRSPLLLSLSLQTASTFPTKSSSRRKLCSGCVSGFEGTGHLSELRGSGYRMFFHSERRTWSGKASTGLLTLGHLYQSRRP